MTLILSTGHPLHEAVILVIFIMLAVLTGLLAVRSAWRGWPLVEKTFETSVSLPCGWRWYSSSASSRWLRSWASTFCSAASSRA